MKIIDILWKFKDKIGATSKKDIQRMIEQNGVKVFIMDDWEKLYKDHPKKYNQEYYWELIMIQYGKMYHHCHRYLFNYDTKEYDMIDEYNSKNELTILK